MAAVRKDMTKIKAALKTQHMPVDQQDASINRHELKSKLVFAELLAVCACILLLCSDTTSQTVTEARKENTMLVATVNLAQNDPGQIDDSHKQ